MNIATLTARHARYRPTRTAVVADGTRYSWAELDARINRVANALSALGLRKGDAVATVLDNCLQQLEVYWAGAKLGAVVVPLSPLLRGRGLATLLADAGTSIVVTSASHAAQIDEIRDQLPGVTDFLLTDAESIPGYRSYRELVRGASPVAPVPVPIRSYDPYNIIYSSGTTGLPKGIVHTHEVRAMYAALFASAYRMRPESVVLHAGSLVFNGAYLTLMPSFYLGCNYILHRRFDPERFIDTVRRERVTHTVVVPSQLIALLARPELGPETMASLEMICSVGAPLHAHHKEELERRLPGRFYELYGLTEGFVTILDPTDYDGKAGSVGVPPPMFEMKIVADDGREVEPGEVGEIVGRGPIMAPGYHKRPDLTADVFIDGWLRTGDLGYVDEDGFLFLVDRKKDLIISGGVNVYPRDIEEVVVRHPAVCEAAVFGAPDDRWGETPIAAVRLHEPGSATPEALRTWTNERVEARFQRIREVVVLDDFPRGVTGKTLKRAMRDAYATERPASEPDAEREADVGQVLVG
jgi:acyl-CoA synthetase (AMP-forming)/AMP-acid ligase II